MLGVLASTAWVVLIACSDDPAAPDPSPTASEIAPSPSVVASPSDPDPGASPPEGIDLEDGRHAAFLTELDLAGRELTVDVIQFLTGQEAVDAYQADNPEDPEGPPNDYYIVNANPRLRAGHIAPDADVTLVKLLEDGDADSDEASLEELAEYLELELSSTVPFWITVESGTITGIEEQYVP